MKLKTLKSAAASVLLSSSVAFASGFNGEWKGPGTFESSLYGRHENAHLTVWAEKKDPDLMVKYCIQFPQQGVSLEELAGTARTFYKVTVCKEHKFGINDDGSSLTVGGTDIQSSYVAINGFYADFGTWAGEDHGIYFQRINRNVMSFKTFLKKFGENEFIKIEGQVQIQ